jgi:hypothetical protein
MSQARKKFGGNAMAVRQNGASEGSNSDLAAHERTYHGFLLLLKFSAAISAVTMALLYFFLAR